jgi:hypothetical protein
MYDINIISQNHSVASSSPNAPCTPDNAVFSDFQNVPNVPAAKNAGKAKATGKGLLGLRAAAPANPPTFSMPVMDTQPMYIYCSQAQHCQQGMVMVINPPTGNTRRAAAVSSPLLRFIIPIANVSRILL